ncbi:MAG: hypothetical protein BWY82_02938 [Verrucomicrobia bacterium ADurb.Bin474]|nr:MAG: hypothetical protein BWY82_02938 [Verrucomicrobia bacterium ADurb.Bin474]
MNVTEGERQIGIVCGDDIGYLMGIPIYLDRFTQREVVRGNHCEPLVESGLSKPGRCRRQKRQAQQ